MSSPRIPSFKWDNLDVLLHPEVYTLKSDKFNLPDFEGDEPNDDHSKYVLLPKNRYVHMEPLNPQI